MTVEPLQTLIRQEWRETVVPALSAYIRIPNRSPLFDPGWEAIGHMQRAVGLLADWCRRQPLRGLQVEVLSLPGRTPTLLVEIPGEAPGHVLLYGHYDKQPEFTGWEAGLEPWTPVRRGDRLYGRGGADDGYAVFASVLAIRALQEAGLPHARCTVLIEGSEESGSVDLPAYVEHLGERLGSPDLVVCLDAECGNYDQLWLTSSLRGNLTGTLDVAVLREGVHSGMGTGIAPSAVRIARALIDRLEDATTGDLRLEELYVPVPAERRREALATGALLGAEVAGKLPFLPGVQPLSDSAAELLINSTWKPTLAVTGADGLPAVAEAGNVLLPRVAFKLSLRLPPTLDAGAAAARVRTVLEAQPPGGAVVRFRIDSALGGWHARPTPPWLQAALESASAEWFDAPLMTMGTGGSIPFIGMLAARYPETELVVTGVLGPQSNAHGPNEFLHLPTAEKLTGCVATVLARHARR